MEQSFFQSLGIAGVFLAAFLESGFLIGVAIPGDSILVSSGLLASQGILSLFPLLLFACLGAVLGDSAAYAVGSFAGPRVFHREDSMFFHKDHLEKARAFFARYGSRAIFFARFVPLIRSLTPIMAGASRMPYLAFLGWNILGGIAWACTLVLAGYVLGSSIPNMQERLPYAIAGVVSFFILFPVAAALRTKENRTRIGAALKEIFRRISL